MSRRSEGRRGGRRQQPATPDAARSALLAAVAEHRQGRLEAAATGYRKVLKASPDHPDALHLLGVIAHQRGDHDEAARLIRRAIARNGADAAYHNNLGTVLLERNNAAAAADCFERALALAPAYAEAANNLGNALQVLGRPHKALAHYEQALGARPDYAEAWYNRGRCEQAIADPVAAAVSYRRAVAARADYVKAMKALGEALAELGRFGEAESELRRALARAPGDVECLAALAALQERRGDLREALETADAAQRLDGSHVRAAIVAAKCHRRLGDVAAAVLCLQSAQPGDDVEAQAVLAYELGACLDRSGRYADAFQSFAEGNRLLLSTPAARSLDARTFPGLVERLRERFTVDWVASWTAPPPMTRPPPVFLIGFPRSGTTLLDQILDSHPGLRTIEEKPMLDIVRQQIEMMPAGYPDALATLSAADIDTLRAKYFHEAERLLGAVDQALIVDKMPLNTIDVGLIHRLFPEAPILLALRHPCDVVLSGYMQAFKPNASMIHFATLEGTARLYAGVMALWQQYAAVLPLKSMTCRYEDLVADLAAMARRILAFLELPWDDAVLAYADHARTRAIATPSYHQVVQPIYSRSIGRWHHYREQMTAVLEVLAPFIDAFGYRRDDAGL